MARAGSGLENELLLILSAVAGPCVSQLYVSHSPLGLQNGPTRGTECFRALATSTSIPTGLKKIVSH